MESSRLFTYSREGVSRNFIERTPAGDGRSGGGAKRGRQVAAHWPAVVPAGTAGILELMTLNGGKRAKSGRVERGAMPAPPADVLWLPQQPASGEEPAAAASQLALIDDSVINLSGLPGDQATVINVSGLPNGSGASASQERQEDTPWQRQPPEQHWGQQNGSNSHASERKDVNRAPGRAMAPYTGELSLDLSGASASAAHPRSPAHQGGPSPHPAHDFSLHSDESKQNGSRERAPAPSFLAQGLATARSLSVLIICLLLTTAWFLHGAISDVVTSIHPTVTATSDWPAAAPRASAPPSPPGVPGGPVVAWRQQPPSCSLKDFVGLMGCRHGCAAARSRALSSLCSAALSLPSAACGPCLPHPCVALSVGLTSFPEPACCVPSSSSARPPLNPARPPRGGRQVQRGLLRELPPLPRAPVRLRLRRLAEAVDPGGRVGWRLDE